MSAAADGGREAAPPPRDRAEIEAWLRLLLAPGVSRTAARRLLAAFGSPEAVLGAAPTALRSVVDAAAAAALQHTAPDHAARLAAALAWLEGGPARHVVTVGDARYPPQLLQTPDPPLLLYVQGNPALLAAPALAVVGSRNPSVQGQDNARRFARALADGGLLVVSGLAVGIDGAAHEGALDAGAATLAVVGTGLDRVYPRRHHALAHRIAERGAIVGEYVPGTPPLAENFPQRNRIIAGLTLGTLVVEAALRSGSLITARLAAEYGREVYAVPGSIQSAQSRGCHALIRDGAKLVETAADVLDELRRPLPAAAPRPEAAPAPPAAADIVLEALGHDPVTLDALQARTGMSVAELLARLLDLELAGDVARLPGGLFQRRGAA